MKQWIFQSVLIDTHRPSAKTAPPLSQSHDIYIYLKLVCHDKQNGG